MPEQIWDIETVPDWSKRIAHYTDEQRKFYTEMVPKINELKNIMKSTTDWSVILEKKDKGEELLVQTKKSVRGLTICRGQGPVDWSPVEIWRCMSCAAYK